MALRQSSDKEPSIELFIKVSHFMSKQSSEEKGHSVKGLLLIYECCQTTMVHNYCQRGSNNQRKALFLIGAVPRYHTLQMLGCLYPWCGPQLVSYRTLSNLSEHTQKEQEAYGDWPQAWTDTPTLVTHTFIYLKVTKTKVSHFLFSHFFFSSEFFS